MQGVWDWFRWLYDEHGINFSVFYDPFDRSSVLGGLMTTLKLAGACLLGSLVVGVVTAWLQGSRVAPVRRAATGLVEFIRNTPPLVQLYFFYFGLSPFLSPVDPHTGLAQPILGAYLWAVIALSLYEGVFNAEALRAGIDAVPQTTIETCEAFAMSRWQTFTLVVLPLALRTSLPALTNNTVNLIKSTTLAYAIGVPEILSISTQIWADRLNVLEMMIVLLAVYMLLIGALTAGMGVIERQLRLPGFGGQGAAR
jgi:polar amino acid transport system permease protein